MYYCWWVSHNNGKYNKEKANLNKQHNLKSALVHLQDIVSHISSISDLNKICGNGSAKSAY